MDTLKLRTPSSCNCTKSQHFTLSFWRLKLINNHTNQMKLVHITALTLHQYNGLSCSSCRSLFFVNQKLFAANLRFQQSFYQNITHAYDHSQSSVVADGLCAMSCSSPIVWINLYTESLLDANTIGHTLACDALA